MTACLGGDEELCKALIPTYPLGCRRMTPGPGYLEALRSPNAEVVTEGIASIVKEGIQLESGEVIKLDAIICATGFDTSFAPRFPLVGRHGNVQDKFREETPRSYMSCALSGVPNYFSKKLCIISWSLVITRSLPVAELTSSSPNSYHGPKCPHRTWKRIHVKRTHRAVYNARHSQMSSGGHQSNLPV